MEAKKTFEKYYDRLAHEGLIKAIISGLIIAFAALFVVALVLWFVDLPLYAVILLSIGAGVLAGGVAVPLLYAKKFRPTAKAIARRIDKLGLEERLITMTELENDESYIAMRQREDAKEKLRTVETKNISMKLSRAAIVLVAVFGALGISMTTVSSLAASGAIAKGGEVIEDLRPDTYYAVSYLAEEGGYIEGEAEQLVLPGEDATTVVAVAEDGFIFAYWAEDESEDPARTDTNIQEDTVYTAVFMELGDGEGGAGEGGDGEGEQGEDSEQGEGEGDQGDQPQDAPSEGGEGQQQQQPQPQPSEQPGEGGEGDGAGGTYNENNQILDGDTYYRDVLQEYYERAMEYLANGEDIPPELKAFVEAYYETIQ